MVPGAGLVVLVVTVKLEARELAELMTEEREEREEERSVEVLVVVVESDEEDTEEDKEDKEEEVEEDKSDEPKEEVGGCSDVTEGRGGIEVEVPEQPSELPAATVITPVALPRPLESPRTITTLVPAGIVTRSQVNEVPVTSVKAARTSPSMPSL